MRQPPGSGGRTSVRRPVAGGCRGQQTGRGAAAHAPHGASAPRDRRGRTAPCVARGTGVPWRSPPDFGPAASPRGASGSPTTGGVGSDRHDSVLRHRVPAGRESPRCPMDRRRQRVQRTGFGPCGGRAAARRGWRGRQGSPSGPRTGASALGRGPSEEPCRSRERPQRTGRRTGLVPGRRSGNGGRGGEPRGSEDPRGASPASSASPDKGNRFGGGR
jgi:hypothetical protein